MDSDELLVITMEECGELIQACSKVMRSGGKKKYIKNLREEICDVLLMCDLLKQYGYYSDQDVDKRNKVKREKLRRWSNLDV